MSEAASNVEFAQEIQEHGHQRVGCREGLRQRQAGQIL